MSAMPPPPQSPAPPAGVAAAEGPEAPLQALLQRGQVWRGRQACALPRGVWPSGQPPLDAALPGGGWPRQGLVDCLAEGRGFGELALFAPLLRAAGRACWLAPPHVPYAPALQQWGLDLREQLWLQPAADERLWAAETVLQSGLYPLLLAWLPAAGEAALRRLSLAAEEQGVLLLAWRGLAQAAQACPARLRLRLAGTSAGLRIDLFKGRGLQPRSLLLSPESADVVALSARPAAGAGVPDAARHAA